MDSDDRAERIAQYEQRVREIRSLAEASHNADAQEGLLRLAGFYESMICNMKEWNTLPVKQTCEKQAARDPDL